MNPYYPVKEEYCNWWSSSSSSASESSGSEAPIPKPIEGLHDAGPPPFLTKIYDMVDDQSIDHIVSWSRCGQSFVVWDVHAFSTNLLPKYFKHSNFSSFVRQLNTYGFRKIDPDVWEFANEAFSKGQRHNLKNIKRRKAPSQAPPPQQAIGPCVEVGRFGLDGEVERLRRDKQILLMELVKLRQQQQNTRAHLQAMELRLQGTERKQQKMMSFLAKAMQNPKFIQKLVQHGKRKELEEAIMKKRRRPIDQGPSGVKSGKKLIQNGDGSSKLIKLEPEEFGDPYGFQVSELEALALEMQGIGKSKRYNQEEQELSELEEFECEHKELDEEFWDELLSERYDEGLVANCNEEGEESDVNFLVDKLDFLRSSPK